MTTKTVKLITFIVLLVHGIGHFQGVAAGVGVRINNSNAWSSWLLKGLDEKITRPVCLILFLLTGLIGISTALSFKDIWIQESAWQTLALITAFFSSACLILFPNGYAMFFNKIGAVAVNLLIYYSILLNNQWPSGIFED